ncbi:MAG: DMT family transporter [Pseudomonadota bacterium]
MNSDPIHRTMTTREWVMLIVLSVLWGGSFFFIEIGVRNLAPVTVVWMRVSLAALALLIILQASGKTPKRLFQFWPAFAGMAILNNVIPFMAFAWGQTQIASGLAAILNATTPFFTVIVAHFLLPDENATLRHVFGVLVGVIGVVLIFSDDLGMGATDNAIWGQLACIGAAISYGFAGWFGRRFRQLDVTPIETATGQVTASSVILLLPMLLLGAPEMLLSQSLPVWGALLGLALVSTAFAYILFFRILATAGATNIMLVTFLVPASAILLGATFLSETLTGTDYAGLFVIGLGLAVIDGRPFAAFRRALQRLA